MTNNLNLQIIAQMLARKTVLILGAGASFECKFPLGHDLLTAVQHLCANPQSDSNFLHLLRSCSIEPQNAREMAERIEESPVRSIDLLLQYRNEYVDVGKAAIANILVPHEVPQRLSPPAERNKSWYAYLFEQMRTTEFGNFAHNPLTIVTYNYDRSMDAFLRRSLMTLYNKSTDEVEKIMEDIPIIHLHGQLGTLKENPYIQYKTENTLPYREALKRAKQGIKIIHEVDDADRDQEYVKAREAIKIADRVIFLGFGFGQENLKRLKTRESTSDVIFATAYGMTDDERRIVSAETKRGAIYSWGAEDETILAFLRRSGCLERKID